MAGFADPSHRITAGMVTEPGHGHLRGLEELPPSGFRFSAVPAPVAGLGSFPVRTYARWERGAAGRPGRRNSRPGNEPARTTR
jgi:hypothetical protein